MLGLTHRLQVRIDSDQLRRLEHAAAQRGTSVATLVREAIDATLLAGDQDRRAAARQLLSSEPIGVGDWAAVRQELDTALERSDRWRGCCPTPRSSCTPAGVAHELTALVRC